MLRNKIEKVFLRFKQVEDKDPKVIFLNDYVFYGLTNLNDGFDASVIKYFNEEDFRIVLQRCEKLRIGIYGIEPWLNGEFYWVETYEDYTTDPADPLWYNKVFEDFVKFGEELQYAASYYIPDNMMRKYFGKRN